MKIKLFMLVGLFAIGFAVSANAGAVSDNDSDGVPDAFDNCQNAVFDVGNQNGPSAGGCSAQQNFDGDAYGDACDGDYDNDTDVDGVDFNHFFASFKLNSPQTGDEDSDCDTDVDGVDFNTFFKQFKKNAPGLP
jgi:hypothetical protein